MIKRFEIKVRQPLIDIVPNGKPSVRALRDHRLNNRKKTLILDFSPQLIHQTRNGNTWIVFLDVQLQTIFRILRMFQSAFDVICRIFPAASGDRCTGVRVHPAHQHILHHVHKHLVHDPIGIERDNADRPLFSARQIDDLFRLRRGRRKFSLRNKPIHLFGITIRVFQHPNDIPALPFPAAADDNRRSYQITVAQSFV